MAQTVSMGLRLPRLLDSSQRLDVPMASTASCRESQFTRLKHNVLESLMSLATEGSPHQTSAGGLLAMMNRRRRAGDEDSFLRDVLADCDSSLQRLGSQSCKCQPSSQGASHEEEWRLSGARHRWGNSSARSKPTSRFCDRVDERNRHLQMTRLESDSAVKTNWLLPESQQRRGIETQLRTSATGDYAKLPQGRFNIVRRQSSRQIDELEVTELEDVEWESKECIVRDLGVFIKRSFSVKTLCRRQRSFRSILESEETLLTQLDEGGLGSLGTTAGSNRTEEVDTSESRPLSPLAATNQSQSSITNETLTSMTLDLQQSPLITTVTGITPGIPIDQAVVGSPIIAADRETEERGICFGEEYAASEDSISEVCAQGSLPLYHNLFDMSAEQIAAEVASNWSPDADGGLRDATVPSSENLVPLSGLAKGGTSRQLARCSSFSVSNEDLMRPAWQLSYSSDSEKDVDDADGANGIDKRQLTYEALEQLRHDCVCRAFPRRLRSEADRFTTSGAFALRAATFQQEPFLRCSSVLPRVSDENTAEDASPDEGEQAASFRESEAPEKAAHLESTCTSSEQRLEESDGAPRGPPKKTERAGRKRLLSHRTSQRFSKSQPFILAGDIPLKLFRNEGLKILKQKLRRRKWPTTLLDGLARAQVLEQLRYPRRSHEGLQLAAAGYIRPHPYKIDTGGEDAFFVSRQKNCVGVADGVGEWKSYGVDPKIFSEELMLRCQQIVESGYHIERAVESVQNRAQVVLQEAFHRVTSIGGSTAVIACMDESGSALEIANIGDSTAAVLRRNRLSGLMEVAFRSAEQQHTFNMPFQLVRLPHPKDLPRLESEGRVDLARAAMRVHNGKNEAPLDTPSDATAYRVPLEEGDLVVLGTDGLFDNLFEEEIAELSSMTIAPVEAEELGHCELATAPEKIAKLLVEAAYWRSLDRSAKIPFSIHAEASPRLDEAQKNCLQLGGKPDDIAAVVCWVVSACFAARADRKIADSSDSVAALASR